MRVGALILSTVVFWGCGISSDASKTDAGETKGTLKITSTAYAGGAMIPARFTADGEDIHPPLRISGIPEGCRSLALIFTDPDAPMGTWIHWVVWNLPPDTRELPAGVLPQTAREGRNSFGRKGYGGPSPPEGTHRYFLSIRALDTLLDLPPLTDSSGLLRAMKGHVLAEGSLMGRYSR